VFVLPEGGGENMKLETDMGKFYCKAPTVGDLHGMDTAELERILTPLLKGNTKALKRYLKPLDAKPRKFITEAVLELPKEKFEYFEQHLLDDTDIFTEELQEKMFIDEEAIHCVAITASDCPYALLVDTEGTDYARYVAKVDKVADND
jgi:hypothetical protein